MNYLIALVLIALGVTIVVAGVSGNTASLFQVFIGTPAPAGGATKPALFTTGTGSYPQTATLPGQPTGGVQA